MSKINDDILMRKLENTFSYFAEQVINKEYLTKELELADIVALTAVDILVTFCTSIGNCQDCIFYNKDCMCDLFSRIRQKTGKEML